MGDDRGICPWALATSSDELVLTRYQVSSHGASLWSGGGCQILPLRPVGPDSKYHLLSGAYTKKESPTG